MIFEFKILSFISIKSFLFIYENFVIATISRKGPITFLPLFYTFLFHFDHYERLNWFGRFRMTLNLVVPQVKGDRFVICQQFESFLKYSMRKQNVPLFLVQDRGRQCHMERFEASKVLAMICKVHK